MIVDFELQLHILETASSHYPKDIDVDEYFPNQRDNEKFQANCIYLRDHKLIEMPLSNIDPVSADIPVIRITTRGVDFLLPSGGISSLLNTVTIKFDAEQIREILIAHINSHEKDPKKKSRAREIINGLTVEVLKTLFFNLGAKGLAHLPDVYQLLQIHEGAASVGAAIA